MKKVLSVLIITIIMVNAIWITGASANVTDEGMAELVSTMHRRIPTQFKKSNDLSDILHFQGMTAEEQEAAYNAVRGSGEVVCTEEEFLQDIRYTGTKYGKGEVVSVSGMPFAKVLRITCTEVPENSVSFVVTTGATPEKTPGEGVSGDDVMLLSFMMRTVSSDYSDGAGKIQVQIEHPKTYAKALFDFVTAGSQWTAVYLPFTGVEDATSICIRGGFAKQVVELGGVEIINLGPDFDIQKLPKTGAYLPELDPDAAWRTEANKRIEEIRKGDFSVVVKDKNGRVVPNAQVEFDMFEHEFQFGNAFNGSIVSNKTYTQNHEMLFNAGVVEHAMKWAPFEDNPAGARAQVNAAKAAGVKYLRGHTLFWEITLGSNGVTYITPEYMTSDDIMSGNRAKYDELCEKHTKEICEAYYGEVCDWDVVNEITFARHFTNVFGSEPWKSQFEWARKYAGDDVDLYYNDYAQFSTGWEDTLQELIDTGAQFDGIGFQSHYDGNLVDPTKVIQKYRSLENYGDKKLKVTEFSCSIPDTALQANFTRDMLIAAFAEDDMDGFLYWGFWDGSNFAAYSPFYDSGWNLKPAGEQYIDLVYNKWWTRDAKATTDAKGKATINGFYGDYDVTVNADGHTKTVMAAYHKGYENELEIILDDYEIVNSRNDMFSFVYSGKVQIDGRLTSDYTDNHPDYMSDQVTLVMTDGYGNIGHVAQTSIKPDGTYSFEFKKDGLKYEDGKIKDYYITLNVNGIPVTDTVNTSMIIPECVTFDFDVTQTDGKINMVTTLNNLIRRKGLDYTVYTAFYNGKNTLLSFKRSEYTSTGAANDILNVSGLEIPAHTQYIKVFVWMNNSKMIPLSASITKDIN